MGRFICILSSLLLLSNVSLGQKINVQNAGRALKKGDLTEAKKNIDAALLHEETIDLPVTWYYAGFVYKEIYNKLEKSDKNSVARTKAIKHFSHMLEIDQGANGQFTSSAKKSLRYLASTVYNDAVTSLNVTEYEIAKQKFEEHKTVTRLIEKNPDFRDIEIQFYLVLGSVYTQIYNQDKKANKEFFPKIKNVYYYVLEVDTDNVGANYNLGILFYNEGVNRIKSLDYDLDLTTIDIIQQECVDMFRSSLPYMQKAYNMNPKRKETLMGLSGIYFSLNELERSEQIQKELLNLEGDSKD